MVQWRNRISPGVCRHEVAEPDGIHAQQGTSGHCKVFCKHLLIYWKWGEAYFAGKLLDYELSSNVGNWQWASGSGCDAVPYFRIFNPTEQQRKFDPDF